VDRNELTEVDIIPATMMALVSVPQGAAAMFEMPALANMVRMIRRRPSVVVAQLTVVRMCVYRESREEVPAGIGYINAGTIPQIGGLWSDYLLSCPIRLMWLRLADAVAHDYPFLFL
jgi:hypothetical protein